MTSLHICPAKGSLALRISDWDGQWPRVLPTPRFTYATVRELPRQAIFVVRTDASGLSPLECEDIAGRMREKLASRGEMSADVVMVQDRSKETLRLYGNPYSVARVRAAKFNAAVHWTPIEL